MTVKGHTPMQELIARALFGIESVPPEGARRMVSRAARVASAYVERLESKRDALRAERDELLEALEEALEDWDDDHFDEEYPYRIEWADKARKVIAKARGESDE